MEIGDFFGDITCKHGHNVGILNVGRLHYGVCFDCKEYIFLGSNLMSSWRNETKETWAKNKKLLLGFKEIKEVMII